MVRPRELDPSASALAFFGSELRRFRETAGLSQGQLGEIINYVGPMVSMVETAKRVPTRDFVEHCDTALEADGALIRLWPLISHAHHPSWFQDFAELEAVATVIQTFDTQVVPGILQTEDYARAVLRAGRLEDTEAAVVARLERQQVLSKSPPPQVWAILDEAILRRSIGGADVMRGQLRQLIELGNHPHRVLQVLPFSVGAHAGLDGSVIILAFADGADVAYIEGPGSGFVVTQPERVARAQLSYDLVRAAALSPEASTNFIRAVMEEL